MAEVKDSRRQPVGVTQDRRGVLRMVRRFGSRCDFCGRLAMGVAVESGPEGRQVAICSRCVGEAARRLHPQGGGDAA